MSQHLPECQRFFTDMPAPDECPACGMFRVCEQRVFQEQIAGRQYDMALGYQRGLARARRAVQMIEKGGKGRRAHELWRDAIAVIDELREAQ